MAATILFNRRALRAPLSSDDLGALLLHEACKNLPDARKAAGLVASGANLDLKDERGFTALIWAVTKGHDAIAEAIIEASEPEDERETN
jgi:ankyrin repeat protein